MVILNNKSFEKYFYTHSHKKHPEINYNLPFWFQLLFIVFVTSILTPFSKCGSLLFIISWFIWEIGYYVYKRYYECFTHDYIWWRRIVIVIVSIAVREFILRFD